MNKKILSFIVCFIVCSTVSTATLAKQSIQLCYLRHWYPYTYTENKEPKGKLISIVVNSAKAIHQPISLLPNSYKKCLQLSKQKKIDGIIGIPYLEAYSKFLDYPNDIKHITVSHQRLDTIQYYLTTHRVDKKGNLKTRLNIKDDFMMFPEPIRVEWNYASHKLNQNIYSNKIIRQGYNLSQVNQLFSSRMGSVLINASILDELSSSPEIFSNILLQESAISEQDIFLAFTQEGRLSTMEREQFWNEISRQRG